MVFFSKSLQIGGWSTGKGLILFLCASGRQSVCLCLPLSPSFLFSLPPLPQACTVACACISSVYLTCRQRAILSKPTYSSYLREREARWGRGSAQTDFLCSLSQLSMWLQLTAGNNESSVRHTLPNSRGLASEGHSLFPVGFGSMQRKYQDARPNP